MPESTTATLMRIFVDESDRRGAQPLYVTIVEMLRKQGIAGATVFKGIEGYGSHRQIHAARTFDLSTNLPILIEAIDSEEKIEQAIPLLRELIPEGLITFEKVQMLQLRGPQ
ncbi:MAG TPA: DUF190 domain-containing protein [Candidatus Baltobacteraceae bacterium]